jgi:N-acetylneuraminate lyase
MLEISSSVSITRDFYVFSGRDEMAMSGLAFGADGLIGSSYNLFPEPFLDIFKAIAAGDLKTAGNSKR